MREIKFYSVQELYGEFSNFAQYPIKIDGSVWPTSEHYFQAQKFDDETVRQKIRKTRNPGEAARLGRNRKFKLKRNWDNTKINVMRKAVTAKFLQHAELKDMLLSTGDAKLIEHTVNDNFWGDGGDGSGKNMLGKILMAVRDELKKK